jgi:hypothetical protein
LKLILSWETLKRKLTYFGPKFSSFRGRIETKVSFPLNFEKNTKKRSKKLKNFEFFSVLIWIVLGIQNFND